MGKHTSDGGPRHQHCQMLQGSESADWTFSLDLGKERPLLSDRGEGSSRDGRSQSSVTPAAARENKRFASGTRSPVFKPQVHP